MIDVGIINFNVREDNNDFLGIAKVTAPELNNKTISIDGAGIAGTVDMVVPGHIDAMSLKLEFRTVSAKTVALLEQRPHTITTTAAQLSQENGKPVTTRVKYVAVITPTKSSIGTFAPASPADASGEYACSYFALFLNDKKVLEVDPLNYIYEVNGVDYLKESRTALGL